MPRTSLRDGRTLQWSEGGAPAGMPVLFFHGCPDTRRAAWSGHDAARRAGIRLIAANRPGYGASTPAPPSYQRVVDDTSELADALGLEKIGVLGMSVGGTFALACGALLPERVSRVTVVAAPGEAPRMDPAYPRDDLDEAGRELFRSLAAGSLEENVERVRPEFLAWRARIDPADHDDDRVATRWLGSLPAEDRVLVDGPTEEVAAAAREAIGVPDGYVSDAALVFAPWAFRVEDIVCPVTLWYGARDQNAPPRNGRWLADHLDDAALNVMPGLGHLETLVRSWDRILPTAVG